MKMLYLNKYVETLFLFSFTCLFNHIKHNVITITLSPQRYHADASRRLEYLLARAAILNTNYFRRHTTTRNVTSLGFNARNVTPHNVIMTSAHDVLITSGLNNTCILITSGAIRAGKYYSYFKRYFMIA